MRIQTYKVSNSSNQQGNSSNSISMATAVGNNKGYNSYEEMDPTERKAAIDVYDCVFGCNVFTYYMFGFKSFTVVLKECH